ncbi:hypothetical protein [Streptomyces sp. NPDC051677]|uniref:hypothetical protein n=1 Tax=Streptomyces sp. NPDC051677 TaxID=3365669 RepID=UPI0037CFD5F4
MVRIRPAPWRGAERAKPRGPAGGWLRGDAPVKGAKGKRTRKVPVVEEIRPLVARLVLSAGPHDVRTPRSLPSPIAVTR